MTASRVDGGSTMCCAQRVRARNGRGRASMATPRQEAHDARGAVPTPPPSASVVVAPTADRVPERSEDEEDQADDDRDDPDTPQDRELRKQHREDEKKDAESDHVASLVVADGCCQPLTHATRPVGVAGRIGRA